MSFKSTGNILEEDEQMSNSPLSGDAIVDAFFAELQDMEGVDKALAEKLASLHRDKK